MEGQRIFPAAERRLVRDKGREMKKWDGARRLFGDIAIALLVVGTYIRAHLKSKMQNRWAIVIDVWDAGLVYSMP